MPDLSIDFPSPDNAFSISSGLIPIPLSMISICRYFSGEESIDGDVEELMINGCDEIG